MSGRPSAPRRLPLPFSHSPTRPFSRAAALLLLGVFASGCATPALPRARHNFYAGRLEQADDRLDESQIHENDRVLLLMERGTIRLYRGDYGESAKDYIAASDRLEKLETYSVSKGAASLVVNDGVQSFKGTPYERTLLHAFTAKSHLGIGHWENAAVEARRIIRSLEPNARGEYPEDAYSRYVAGFCLEMMDDPSNAALQYRLANALLKHAEIEEATGYLRAKVPTNSVAAGRGPPAPSPWPVKRYENELVCFIALDRSPNAYFSWDGNWSRVQAPYTEIRHKGELLGRSYNLADTAELAYETAKKQATVKTVKTATRVVLKEVAAEAAAHETNDAVGDLVRLILIGILEQPDVRRWETLPRWLQVARVPCPPGIEEYDVLVKNAQGRTVRAIHVNQPIMRRGNISVSFCRDLPRSVIRPPKAKSAPASANP